MHNDLGLIHIYHGDGKGKSTAAVGLAVRAAGAGYKVLISRFLKNQQSGELNILKTIPNICITGSEKDFGFFFQMSEQEKQSAAEFFTEQLKTAFELAADYDMLILDEINVAVDLKLVEESVLTDCIEHKPKQLELVLTGRNPTDTLISLADYVSEIKCIRHPFGKGIPSRKGIEE